MKPVDSAEQVVAELPRTIWYMGVKARVIPGFLDQVLREEVPAGGTVLDLMSGTGVVAAHCASQFRVFTNDVQRYARVIAAAFVEHPPAGKEEFVDSLSFADDIAKVFTDNLKALEIHYAEALEREDQLLGRFADGERGEDWCRAYREFLSISGAVYGDAEKAPVDDLYSSAAPLLNEESLSKYRNDPSRRPCCLMVAYYANIYFGLRQAIVIDSLRAAIGAIAQEAPEAERRRVHYLSALLHAASTSTSGTSHFAQPRHLEKDSELEAMANRRLIDVLDLFQSFSSSISEWVRGTDFVAGNQCFAGDYRQLLRGELGHEEKLELPGDVDLVYLDPPYTQDNYSRFYHVLEVLTQYDYPTLERGRDGSILRGRYPAIERRFRSGFCSTRRIEEEFRTVARAAAASGSKLVISYSHPSGLLLREYAKRQPGEDPVAMFEALFRETYREVRTERKALMHSGQGDSNKTIDELLVICRDPR